MSKLGLLLSELQRRKVLRVAAAYAFVGWGMLEASSTILQMASAPAWIGKAVLAIVAVGFPISLLLAWFFDFSSAGLVRTASLDAEQRARVLGARFTLSHLFAGIGVLATAALVVGFSVWLRPTGHAEPTFTQLTNFADAATAPALSPDGSMLAFLKGDGLFGNSATPSQVYVKKLPDGDEVQLTNSEFGKATPTFSPDGSRIYFTAARGNFDWHTDVVSVNGGHETSVLPNASGLSFLDADNVLFAEIRKGWHMGLRRATLAREHPRDVYYPGEDGMAHRAAASPDRRWVLVVEMDGSVWQPCRLVPLDGSSTGRPVGPPEGQCTYAAWSPDGRWMYFTTNAGGSHHLWRQRFPRGEPEQLTNGPTEEEGIAVAPDGRSLITSAGVRLNSIWLMDSAGDRKLSVEGFAFSPQATRDGAGLYFLQRHGIARRAYNVGSLVFLSLADGTRDEILPTHPMIHFDLSADDRFIVFASGEDDPARRGIWVAPLDRSSAPRRVRSGDVERVFFDVERNIYFLNKTSTTRDLRRLRAPDYRTDDLVQPGVLYIFDLSPNGQWLAAVTYLESDIGAQHVAISTRGAPPRVICAFCGGGAGPTRVLAPALSWTRDGRALLVSAQFSGPWTASGGRRYTVLVPLPADSMLPPLPSGGIRSVEDWLAFPGARRIAQPDVFPGAHPGQLFYYERTTIRNLYRVTLPE